MKKIIAITIIILFLSVAFEGYILYKVKKQSDLTYQVLEVMGLPDAQGVTGFDKLVVQTLNKINESTQKK